MMRRCASAPPPRGSFDPAEIHRGQRSDVAPPIFFAVLPLVVVVVVNLSMSLFVLPRLDFSFLAEDRWGGVTISAVAGVWSVVVALAAAIATVVFFNHNRLRALRQSMDGGANASVLPALSVASLVGFGAVIEESGDERGSRRKQQHAPAAEGEPDEEAKPNKYAQEAHTSALRQQHIQIGGRALAQVLGAHVQEFARGPAPLGPQHCHEVPLGVELRRGATLG
jgi:hypothetical protein